MLVAEAGKPLWGDGSAVESDLYFQMGAAQAERGSWPVWAPPGKQLARGTAQVDNTRSLDRSAGLGMA